jgi:hypothetical protein
MKKRYMVILKDEEKEYLKSLTKKGKVSARKIIRSQILLQSNDGKKDKEIKEILGTSLTQIALTRKKFIEGGLEYALNDFKNERQKSKLDARGKATLVKLAGSKPPKGHKKWSIRLLSAKLAELKIVDNISYETVRQILKKQKKNIV